MQCALQAGLVLVLVDDAHHFLPATDVLIHRSGNEWGLEAKFAVQAAEIVAHHVFDEMPGSNSALDDHDLPQDVP